MENRMNKPLSLVAILALGLAACSDRALSEDLEPRVQDYCDAWCPASNECLPVAPDYLDPGTWEAWQEACASTCVEGNLDRLENPDYKCELETFERQECIASKNTCEALRAAYFYDGSHEESCGEEWQAEVTCLGGGDMQPRVRPAEMPTP